MMKSIGAANNGINEIPWTCDWGRQHCSSLCSQGEGTEASEKCLWLPRALPE